MVGSPSRAPGRKCRAWYHPYRLAQSFLIGAALVYLGLLVVLYTLQTGLVYVGLDNPFSPDEAQLLAHRAGLIPWPQDSTGMSSPGYVRPDFTQPTPRGTIVFFHGNGDMSWEWAEDAEGMRQRGFRVFLYEYPGYGGRPGRPSEKVIVPDAEELVSSLAKSGYSPIYLWGHSLGSGVASAVCADKALPIQGLTLVVPFDTIRNVAGELYPYFPVHYLMTDDYDSISNLQHFGHPICVIRGDEDGTILPERTLNLYAHLPEPKKMIVMKGYGHGNWSYAANESWWDEALDFMAPKAKS